MITLEILGPPHAQMRPRAGKTGGFTRIYKHKNQAEAENTFISQLCSQLPDGHKLLEGPLEIVLKFYLPRPMAHFGSGKNAGTIKKSAPQYPTVKPDFDNGIKHVCDCCNGIVWKDDVQIVRARIDKRYDHERPRTEITVRELCP